MHAGTHAFFVFFSPKTEGGKQFSSIITGHTVVGVRTNETMNSDFQEQRA